MQIKFFINPNDLRVLLHGMTVVKATYQPVNLNQMEIIVNPKEFIIVPSGLEFLIRKSE